jgi:hypothetical protein
LIISFGVTMALCCKSLHFGKERTMDTTFPGFFATTPGIVVHDALAEFLGAVRGGVIEYHFVDAVRLAGHSCPTVAAAYLMARAALRQLFPDTLPERGAIGVDCRGARDAGVNGVMAAVFTLITGAGDEGGFHGIGAHFDRRGLLRFDQAGGGEFRCLRLDTRAAVEVSAHLERVPFDPRVRELMPSCLADKATAEQRELFGQLWQERVSRIFEHADDPALIAVKRV